MEDASDRAEPSDSSQAHISIGAAARAAGLSPDLIRAWERRYGAVTPVRTETGRRRYRPDQVERLRLLGEATRSGHAISAIACVPTPELRRLLASGASDELSSAGSKAAGPKGRGGDGDPLSGAIEAIRTFDAPMVLAVLERGLARVGSERLIEDIITPLLHRVGDAWESGELTEAHEHFVTAAVRTFLGGLTSAIPEDPAAPVVIVATPEGERHELGALLAAWAAVIEGWRGIYLGCDLPPAALRAAARATGARAVALSVTCGASETALREMASTLSEMKGLEIWIGGSGRRALASLESGLRSLESIETLRAELRAWFDPPAA